MKWYRPIMPVSPALHRAAQLRHQRLGDVTVPTLVVVGDNDVVRSNHVTQAQVLPKWIPNAEHKVVKGQSHGFF